MADLLPGTDIELGKWYPATQTPPAILDNEQEGSWFTMILGIPQLGPIPGFYSTKEGLFYWHCERYDEFDDEPIEGWTRSQEINNNLDWVYDVAKGVSCWMIIPGMPDFPTIQDDAKNSYIGSIDSDDDLDEGLDEDDNDDSSDDFFDERYTTPNTPVDPRLN